jgi:hypothetical protein
MFFEKTAVEKQPEKMNRGSVVSRGGGKAKPATNHFARREFFATVRLNLKNNPPSEIAVATRGHFRKEW